MRIHRIRISDFAQIKSWEDTFPDGVILFHSAGNGQGKSTVFRALALLLFNLNPGNLKDYVTWGTENPYSIECDFEHKGSEYFTSLRYDPSSKSSKRKLVDKTDEVEWDNSAAVEHLDQIFNVSRAVPAVLSFEHDIDLINTRRSARRDYMKSVFDIDFKKSQERVEADRKETKSRIDYLQAEIDTLSAQIFETKPKKRLPFPSSELETRRKEVGALREKILGLQAEIQDIEKKIESVDEQKRKHQEVVSRRLQIEEKIRNHHKKKDKLKSEIQDLENFDLEENDFIQSLKASIKSNQDALEEIKKNRHDLIVQKEIEKEELEDLQKSFSEGDLENLKERRSLLRGEISRLRESLESLRDGVCPTCGTECSKDHVKSFEDDLSNAEAEFEDLDTLDIPHLQNTKERIQSLRELVLDKERKIEDGDLDITRTTQEIDVLEKSLQESREKKLQEIREDIDQKKEYLQEVLEYIDSFEADLKHTQQEEESLEVPNIEELDLQKKEKTQSLSDLKQDLSTAEEEIGKFESIKTENALIDKHNAEVEQKKKQNQEQVQIKEKERTDLITFLQNLDRAKSILRSELPAFLLSSFIQKIERDSNDFLSRTYPKYKLYLEENKDGIDVLFGPDKADVKTQASGYEKQIFSMAYKYALGKNQDYKTLFLDEVDSASSDENSRLFCEALGNASRESYNQVFLISHRTSSIDLLTSDFDARVYCVDEGEIKRV